jgi:hypothetical protein
MDLRDIGCGGTNWIVLAQNTRDTAVHKTMIDQNSKNYRMILHASKQEKINCSI